MGSRKPVIKLSTVDGLFSKYIRARDRFCMAAPCGKDCDHENPIGHIACGGYLQAAHVHSRRYYATRFDPANCFALCLHHHKYETEHPIAGRRWWRHFLGEDEYERLENKADRGLQGVPLDLKAIAADLRVKLKEQEAA